MGEVLVSDLARNIFCPGNGADAVIDGSSNASDMRGGRQACRLPLPPAQPEHRERAGLRPRPEPDAGNATRGCLSVLANNRIDFFRIEHLAAVSCPGLPEYACFDQRADCPFACRVRHPEHLACARHGCVGVGKQ